MFFMWSHAFTDNALCLWVGFSASACWTAGLVMFGGTVSKLPHKEKELWLMSSSGSWGSLLSNFSNAEPQRLACWVTRPWNSGCILESSSAVGQWNIFQPVEQAKLSEAVGIWIRISLYLFPSLCRFGSFPDWISCLKISKWIQFSWCPSFLMYLFRVQICLWVTWVL